MMRQEYSGGWPRWPYLPVKKSNPKAGFPTCGILIDSGPLGKGVEVKPIVYNHNLFDSRPMGWTKILAQYSSLEELVDDGWVVD
jgi:hypothetical protein